MKKLFCIFLLLFLGCEAALNSGTIINKYIDPPHDDICPMCMGLGFRHDGSLDAMLPCMFCGVSGKLHTPQRHVIVFSKNGRRGSASVSEGAYNFYELGELYP